MRLTYRGPVLFASLVLASGGAFVAAGPAASAATPVCGTGQLYLSVGRAQGAAGSFFYPIEFTNTGTTACHLTGYPGVSVVDVAHRQIGAPAARNGEPYSQVTIAPAGTANAFVRTNDPGVVPSCRPTATYLRVFPPASFSAVLIPYRLRVCGAFDVAPVRPGVG